jgi:hypothetical protein
MTAPFPRGVALAVTLGAVAVSVVTGTAASMPQGRAPWLRTESPRFEVHYLPAQAADVDRVIASAERAYDRIGGRLRFAIATKVPVVLFAPGGPLSRDEVVAYGISDAVAPQHPHRSRMVVPLGEAGTDLDGLIRHELTHLLVGELLVPHAAGDGGVPDWIKEGIASYMAGDWPEDRERLLRELVAAGRVPALSHTAGDGGFANPRLNDALGHAAFDYIESRWGAAGIRRFLDALIVPRTTRTYDAVFELTPAEFDAAFRLHVERRFGPR